MKLKLLQKIRVVSREHTATMLLKYIDEDVLPAFLGGKKCDSSGNPMCTEFLKFGGRIPEKYYLRNRPPLLSTDPGVMSVWVAPRSVFNYSVVVREPRSKIRIEYRYENGSVDTKMLFRPFGPNPDELDLPAADEYLDEDDPKCNARFVSPAIRVQGHLTPVEEACIAPWPGIYIFQFNNSYSWFTSRRIIFRIKSIPLES
ncbi:SEC14-like protein 2 [Uloborus diversus]|uniref:SEC14-like protein 2 n=1 Tax=Uloborus diversus TaxID=327109 RepID=UPI002409D9D1|nr:SEC14-like protein 2 [Uloborus diversus]